MHTSGQLSASYVSLLIGVLVVCDCVFYCFYWTCFVTEIKLSYLILSYLNNFLAVSVKSSLPSSTNSRTVAALLASRAYTRLATPAAWRERLQQR